MLCTNLNKILSAICNMFSNISYMFCRLELARLAHGFREIAGFPLVIGAIDGTHIPLLAPSEEENAYVNRKGTHSVNVMVCVNYI